MRALILTACSYFVRALISNIPRLVRTKNQGQLGIIPDTLKSYIYAYPCPYACYTCTYMHFTCVLRPFWFKDVPNGRLSGVFGPTNIPKFFFLAPSAPCNFTHPDPKNWLRALISELQNISMRACSYFDCVLLSGGV